MTDGCAAYLDDPLYTEVKSLIVEIADFHEVTVGTVLAAMLLQEVRKQEDG